jgi:hypothetical protein
MKISGMVYRLPREIRMLCLVFLAVLNLGYFGGLAMVRDTTAMAPDGIETHYLGNEADETAELMKFKKSKSQVLTLVHNHILSLAVIFFLFALMLSMTEMSIKWKLFLMLEPFLSIVLTFGGIYLVWMGITWFKYIVLVSGVVMTGVLLLGTAILIYQLTNTRRLKN